MNNCENLSSIFARFGLITAIILMLTLLSSCANVNDKVKKTDLNSLSEKDRTELLFSAITAIFICDYGNNGNCKDNPDISEHEFRRQLITRIIESGPIDYGQVVGSIFSGGVGVDPGTTVLHAAVSKYSYGENNKNLRIIELMLKDGAQEKINQQVNRGYTALSYTSLCPATTCKDVPVPAERMYKLLLSYGADDSIPDNRGYTPKYYYLQRQQEKNNPTSSSSSGGIDGDTLMQALVIGADAALAEKQRQINEANMIRQQQIQYQQQHQQRLQQQSNTTNYSNNNYQQNNLSPQQQYEAEMSVIRNSRIDLSTSSSNSVASSGNQNTYSYFSVLISDKFNGQQAIPAIGTKYGNGLVVGYRDRYQPKLCPSTSLEILRVPIVKVSVNTQAEINTRVEQTRKSKNGAAFSTLEEAQNNYIKSDSPYFSSDEAINAIKNRSCGGVTPQ